MKDLYGYYSYSDTAVDEWCDKFGQKTENTQDFARPGYVAASDGNVDSWKLIRSQIVAIKLVNIPTCWTLVWRLSDTNLLLSENQSNFYSTLWL